MDVGTQVFSDSVHAYVYRVKPYIIMLYYIYHKTTRRFARHAKEIDTFRNIKRRRHLCNTDRYTRALRRWRYYSRG